MDSLQFRCPLCDKLLQVPARLAGKKVRCTKCSEIVSAPDEDEPEKQAVTAKRPSAKPSPARVRERDDDDERPRGRSRTTEKTDPERGQRGRAKSGGGNRLWLALIPGVLIMVGLIVGGIYVMMRIRGDEDPADKPFVMAKNVNPVVPVQPGFQVGDVNGMQIGDNADLGNKPVPAAIGDADRRRVKQSTVYLRVTMGNGSMGEGSGFFAAEPGLVITNAHVLGMMLPNAAPPKDITVVMNSGEPNQVPMKGILLGADRVRDLAVVRVAPIVPLPAPLKLDSAERLHELQSVYVFGFPFGSQLGLNVTATEAKVSALRKGMLGRVETVQMQGDLHPGNSGGPVVDARGVVVGISVSIIPGTRIANAVPADDVGVLLQGKVSATEVGSPYRAGAGVKAPVKIVLSDPLQKLKTVDLEVWTGAVAAQGAAPAAAGDRKSIQGLAIHGNVATTDIDFPQAKLGGAVFVQPTLVDKNGGRYAAPAFAVFFNDEPPLERVPATFKLSNHAEPERTLILEGTHIGQTAKGMQQQVLVQRVEATLLEQLQANKRGVSIQLHPNSVRVRSQALGKQPGDTSTISAILEHVMLSFLMGEDGGLKERGRPGQLAEVPAPFKEETDAVFNNLANCYEAIGLIVPQQALTPLSNWKTKLPLLLVADGKNEAADMHLTCTYEGRRTKDEQHYAYIRLAGDVRGRNATTSVNGFVDGHLLFDLTHGFIANMHLNIQSELALPGFSSKSVWHVQATRDAGNGQGIVKLDPKASLPDLKTLVSRPPARTIAKGKTIENIPDFLTKDDKIDKRTAGAHFKEYFVKLEAGVSYAIELNAADEKQLDPYLRLETLEGAVLAFDDDGGGGLNARIIYTPRRSGNYKVIATSFTPQQTGQFTLTVSEMAKGGKKSAS